MKLRLYPFLSVTCLLMLSGCGIITPLPTDTYAELRLGDNNKRQLLIESDQWRGVITAEGYQGNKHYTQVWIELQGNGPTYAFDGLVNEVHQIGIIKIDEERKTVTIDLRLARSIEGKQPPYPYNGTYKLASINHNPFYSDSNRK